MIGGTILGRCVRQVIALCSASSVVGSVERLASGEVGALVLDDFLKNIVQDSFRVVRLRDLTAYAQDVATLADVVLDVLVDALVCELGHFDLF